jgi:hypothetical protein
MECQLEGCEREVPPATVGRPRLYCSPEHTRAAMEQRRAERKRGGRPKQNRHSLTVHDEETREATCIVCGPVKAHRVKDKYADGRERIRWVCSNRVKEGSRESRHKFFKSEKGKLVQFRNRYGLTREQAVAAMARKGDGCEICGSTDRRLVYDHDHQTNAHRGWLCDHCNLALGKMGDDPARLERAAAYLRGEALTGIAGTRQSANGEGANEAP